MNQTERKKNAILKITFELLNEKEIKYIKIDDIAYKAGVSKVTIYKHYKSKKDLLNLVIMKDFEQTSKEIEKILQSNLNFEKTYHEFTKIRLNDIRNYSPTYHQNLMTLYQKNSDFFDKTVLHTQNKLYEQLFEKGNAEGAFSKDFTKENYMFMVKIFISGMRVLTADDILENVDLITKFFINGMK